MKTQMADFDKSKHPMKGIPGEGNRFVKKGDGENTSEKGTKDSESTVEVAGAKNVHEIIERYERAHGEIKPETISLPDETLPRSVGAKWANLEIKGPDGKVYHFAEGSKLKNKEIFAGGKCKRKIDEINRLMTEYPGGHKEDWIKVKAQATVVDDYGKESEAEVHWYEEPSIGKQEGKIKKWL